MARAPIPMPQSGAPRGAYLGTRTGSDPRMRHFLSGASDVLSDLSYGLTTAPGWKALGAATARTREMEPYRNQQREQTQQRNATIDWLQKQGRDDLIAQLEAGRPMPEVWTEATAKPKVPDPYILSEGQARYDGNNNLVAQGPQAQPDPKDEFGFEKDLYGQYANADPVKVYEDVKAGYERVRSSASTDSGPGDMGLIYGFMKMLDPTSVVREGEFATAENAGGVAPQVINIYNKLLTGERLTPEQRATFVRAADDLYAQAANNLTQINEQFTDRANAWGVQPGRFIRQPEAYDPWAPAGAQSTTGTATGGFRVVGVR